jgi:hypothetical protein
MGRDRMPLRLSAGGRTLVLHQQFSGDGLAVAIETGRVPHAVCRALIDRPDRPELDASAIYARGVWFELRAGERQQVAAWLAGFYGDAS